jgi:hypothetical protein
LSLGFPPQDVMVVHLLKLVQAILAVLCLQNHGHAVPLQQPREQLPVGGYVINYNRAADNESRGRDS